MKRAIKGPIETRVAETGRLPVLDATCISWEVRCSIALIVNAMRLPVLPIFRQNREAPRFRGPISCEEWGGFPFRRPRWTDWARSRRAAIWLASRLPCDRRESSRAVYLSSGTSFGADLLASL